MTKRKTVAVIGGGVSGLAAAKAFDERGHRVLGFERSHDFGGVWELSRSYPDVQTQSPKDLYRFTDLPMPDDYPEWPKGPQVHAYVHAYAEETQSGAFVPAEHDMFYPWIGGPDGQQGWTLKLEAAGKTWTQDFDFRRCLHRTVFGQEHHLPPGTGGLSSRLRRTGHAQFGIHRQQLSGRQKRGRARRFQISDGHCGQCRQERRKIGDTGLPRTGLACALFHVGGINFKRLSLHAGAGTAVQRLGARRSAGKILSALFKPLIWANFRGLETLLKTQLKLKKVGHGAGCADREGRLLFPADRYAGPVRRLRSRDDQAGTGNHRPL